MCTCGCISLSCKVVCCNYITVFKTHEVWHEIVTNHSMIRLRTAGRHDIESGSTLQTGILACTCTSSNNYCKSVACSQKIACQALGLGGLSQCIPGPLQRHPKDHTLLSAASSTVIKLVWHIGSNQACERLCVQTNLHTLSCA